jgi:hypothetical protein
LPRPERAREPLPLARSNNNTSIDVDCGGRRCRRCSPRLWYRWLSQDRQFPPPAAVTVRPARLSLWPRVIRTCCMSPAATRSVRSLHPAVRNAVGRKHTPFPLQDWPTEPKSGRQNHALEGPRRLGWRASMRLSPGVNAPSNETTVNDNQYSPARSQQPRSTRA